MLANILTLRKNIRHFSYGLVFEWEDVIARELGWSLVDDVRQGLGYLVLRKILPWTATLFKPAVKCLVFDMSADRDLGNNKSTIVPCVIDFFLRSSADLQWFYRAYGRNPLVLISSKEAYDYLVENGCPLNIRHWALSVPDDWVSDKNARCRKKYDVAIMGRTNPVLKRYLDEYCTRHPTLRCVSRISKNGKLYYHDSLTGELMEGEERSLYKQIIRSSKVGLYSTPGMDGANPNANGFNQVTPRFLEYVASGCHILARYPKNSDTEYYKLSLFSPSIGSYEQFERELDRRLTTPVDGVFYADYIAEHLTSVRARQLSKIIGGQGL